MKNALLWDVMPRGNCKNRHFGGTHRLHHQGDKNRLSRNASSNKQLTHSAKIYYVRMITMMLEALLSSETPVLTRAAHRNILDDRILQIFFDLHKPQSIYRSIPKFCCHRYLWDNFKSIMLHMCM
jgi:hypothetical protein